MQEMPIRIEDLTLGTVLTVDGEIYGVVTLVNRNENEFCLRYSNGLSVSRGVESIVDIKCHGRKLKHLEKAKKRGAMSPEAEKALVASVMNLLDIEKHKHAAAILTVQDAAEIGDVHAMSVLQRLQDRSVVLSECYEVLEEAFKGLHSEPEVFDLVLKGPGSTGAAITMERVKKEEE